MNNDSTLKKTFNQEAELYNEIRPTYPDELFDGLVEITKLSPEAHLLEIGPGTGQATKPLAERGYKITAVELGGALAEIARRELAQYPSVEVITGAFEDIELPDNSFDLVYSATAFHWIKPEVRFTKPHRLLKEGGYLAIIHTNHVSDETDDAFYYASQPIYKKYAEERPKSTKDKKSPLMQIDDVKPDHFDEKFFKQVFFKVFPISVSYSADEYIKLLGTFSPTLVMPEDKRAAFLGDIKNLIETEFNNSMTKKYGMTLTIGKKV